MRILVAAIAASIFVLLPGFASASAPNGEASKTIAQILTDMRRAVSVAHSVHVDGAGTGIAIDLRLVAGRGGEGTVAENGLSFNMVRIGTKAYFEATPAFWQHFAGKAAAELFKGRWIEASAKSGQLASFTPLTSIVQLFNQILVSHGTLAKGGETTIDGRSAFALVDTTQGGTLYIAASGPPLPLKLTPKGGKGAINFTGWNQPLSLVAPKNAIDFASLKG